MRIRTVTIRVFRAVPFLLAFMLMPLRAQRAAMNYQGAYAGGTTYQKGDSVASAGVAYVSLIANNTGNTPATSPSDWATLGGLPTSGGTATGALRGAGLQDTNYPTVNAWEEFGPTPQHAGITATNDHCQAMTNALNWAIYTMHMGSALIYDSGAVGPTNCIVNPAAANLESTVGGYGAQAIPVMNGCPYPLAYPAVGCTGVASVTILAGGANYSGTVTPITPTGTTMPWCSVAPTYNPATIVNGVITAITVATAGTCTSPPPIWIPGGEVSELGSYIEMFSPGATYIAQLPWATGYGLTFDGLTPWNNPSISCGLGTCVVPSTGFPPAWPLVSTGCQEGTLNGCNTQGSVIENFGISGAALAPLAPDTNPGPTVTVANNPVDHLTGIKNDSGQNGSRFTSVGVSTSAYRAYDLEGAFSGGGGGAQQSGPYRGLYAAQSGLNDAAAQIFNYGTDVSLVGAVEVSDLTGQCGGNATETNAAVQVDAPNFHIQGITLESCYQTVVVNASHGSPLYGISIRNVNSNNAKYAGLSAVTIGGGATGVATTNAELFSITATPATYNVYVPSTVQGLFSVKHTNGEPVLGYYLAAGGQVATTSIQGCNSLFGECSNYPNSTHTATAAFVPADLNATDGNVEAMAVGATTVPVGILEQGSYNVLSASHESAVQTTGQGPCYFTNSTVTQADFIEASPSGSKGCFDTSSQTPPTSGFTLGRVVIPSGANTETTPSTPTTPSGITSSPSQSGSYAYSVYLLSLTDQTISAATANVTTSTGPTTLGGSSCNTVTGIPTPAAGYQTVVRRETGGASQGALGTTVGTTFGDCGLPGDGSTKPAAALLGPLVNIAVLGWYGGTLTNPMTGVGDMIQGGASGAPARLAAGSQGQALVMGATQPAWQNQTIASTLRAQCTGTATASSTISLSGLGTPTTTCTATSSTSTSEFLANRTGVFKNLAVQAVTGGVNSSSGDCTLYDNGVAKAVTCTLGTSTQCTDTTHTFTAVVGDLYSLRCTTQGSETLANLVATIDFQ
jgi:hypothetical protein